jgi:RAB protein geranylgeranyltransferase component A
MKRFYIFCTILLLLLGGLFYLFLVPHASSAYYGGYEASQKPSQTDLVDKEPIELVFPRGKVNLIPLARYEITAKVQSKQRYVGDWSAKISPYDFALAWGNLVDKKLDKYIKYSQTSRFYLYRYKAGTPVSQQYISEHSANTHIIPANKNIKKALLWIRNKKMVKLEGYLVNVKGTYKKNPVWWDSSTIRTDTGSGACEIMYVTKLYYKHKIYE